LTAPEKRGLSAKPGLSVKVYVKSYKVICFIKKEVQKRLNEKRNYPGISDLSSGSFHASGIMRQQNHDANHNINHTDNHHYHFIRRIYNPNH
jgi:hypothetical protein